MPTPPPRFRVVIAGGGVAALETALAISAIDRSRFDVTLVSPAKEFTYRPAAVLEPFAAGLAGHFAVAEVAEAAGARVIEDELGWVSADEHAAHTASGVVLAYDALVIAAGARQCPAFPHATTIDDAALDTLLHGVVQDVEEGYVKSLAFLQSDNGWRLPAYELALMTAERAREMCVRCDVTVVTPEQEPLEAFGTGVSTVVRRLLEYRGIDLVTGADPEVPSSRKVIAHAGGPALDVDRVIAMPSLRGPGIRGLPLSGRGLLAVDDECQVRGVADVFAVGDAADHPVKHGGLAAQQADVAANAIARAAGCDLEPLELRARIQAKLLTGRDPLYITATLVGATGVQSQVDSQCPWPSGGKVSADHLGRYIAERHPAAVHS